MPQEHPAINSRLGLLPKVVLLPKLPPPSALIIRILRPWVISSLDRLDIRPGLYHYMREADGTFTRFHLRVDSTGHGMLLANASAAARLRTSGIIIAKGLLDGDEESVVVDRLIRSFRGVTIERAAADVDRVVDGVHPPLNAEGGRDPDEAGAEGKERNR